MFIGLKRACKDSKSKVQAADKRRNYTHCALAIRIAYRKLQKGESCWFVGRMMVTRLYAISIESFDALADSRKVYHAMLQVLLVD